VKGYAGATYVADGAKVLENACDILIPAAMEGVIHKGNAGQHQGPADHRGREWPDHLWRG
jgi:glutamate dehydrogenase (NAD(P)+)